MNITDLLLQIQKLFKQNAKSRVIQIKTEKEILAKIDQLMGSLANK